MKIPLLAAALLAAAVSVQAQTKYGRSTGYRVAPNGKLGANQPAAKPQPVVRRNEAPAPEAPAAPAPQAGAKIMPVRNRWDLPAAGSGERVHFGNAPQPEGYGYAINSGGHYLGGSSVGRFGSFQTMSLGGGDSRPTHQSWISELNNVQVNNSGDTRINGNAHNSNGKK